MERRGLTGTGIQRIAPPQQEQRQIMRPLTELSPMEAWGTIATEQQARQALLSIQLSKGKFYSEVLAKMSLSLPEATGFISEMAQSIVSLLLTQGDLCLLVTRCKQGEFCGTAYMPLPTEADIVRIAREIQLDTRYRKASLTENQSRGVVPEIDNSSFVGKTMEELFDVAFEKLGGR